MSEPCRAVSRRRQGKGWPISRVPEAEAMGIERKKQGRCHPVSDVERESKGACTSAGGSWDWLLWFGCHGEGVNVIEDGTMARKIF